jgi:hypothetical protein
MTNAPAYFGKAIIRAVKSFILQTPNLFFVNDQSYKAFCGSNNSTNLSISLILVFKARQALALLEKFRLE